MFGTRKNQETENTLQTDAEGLIWLSYIGPQTRETLVTIKGQLLRALAERRASGQPVKVLADMRGITGSDSSARLESKWFLEEADWDALAIVGNRYLQPIVFFVLRDFKNGRKVVKYFTDAKKAKTWLANPKADSNFNRLKPHNRLKWALPVLIILTILATFSSWRQANERIHIEVQAQLDQTVRASTDAVEDRMRVYTEALYGFRGLFHASDAVNEREYRDYFASLELDKNYPGFNSVNFVTRVLESGRAAFIEAVRGDRSLRPEGDPDFAITPQNDLEEHFVVTYVGVSGVGSDRGVDLAGNEERRTTMQAARDSGQPRATESVQLLDGEGHEQQGAKGFLITIPVYADEVPATQAQRLAQHEGFVNAVFNYQTLFNDALDKLALDDVSIKISDDNGATLYDQGSVAGAALTRNVTMAVSGQAWHMEVRVPETFGLSRTEIRSPRVTLTSGILLTILLTIVFWMQNRGRQRAIDLASAMTEDIKLERNEAIATKNKNEAILSSIGDGVLVLDTSGRIVLFNQAAEQITQLTAANVTGQSYKENMIFLSEKDFQPAENFIAQALSGQSADMPADTVLRRKDGTLVPVADSAAPVRSADGNVMGAVVVFRDITRERQLEKMKDELLSVASHELRTPMGAVRANVAMILEGDYGPVNKGLVEPLTDIKASTVRLVELVNDLLNVARLEAGRMKFTLGEFDVQEIIGGEVANLAALGKEKGVDIVFKPTGQTANVRADADKIKQVLNNLIGNALKFTDKGSITVGTEAKGDKVEVTVTDTGLGITPEDQSKLFGKFQQITTVQDGKPAGTGLGLYISREMVRKMGGELWIKHSEPGKGSTFALTLPLPGTKNAERAAKALEEEAKAHPDQK